ncbi:hypothetical protein GCM10018954_048000 [Kutzneria kofuensis]
MLAWWASFSAVAGSATASGTAGAAAATGATIIGLVSDKPIAKAPSAAPSLERTARGNAVLITGSPLRIRTADPDRRVKPQ